MMSSKLWRHGENWPQRFDLSLPFYDLSLDIMVPGVWQIFRADCAVILRYCKSKSDKKSRIYFTLKHSRILNLQFPQFFKGLKRGLLTKIRCSQWLQGMVLDGLKGFQAKKSKSMTFNYKGALRYLVLALLTFKKKTMRKGAYFIGQTEPKILLRSAVVGGFEIPLQSLLQASGSDGGPGL